MISKPLLIAPLLGFIHEQVLILYVYLSTNESDDTEESVLTVCTISSLVHEPKMHYGL